MLKDLLLCLIICIIFFSGCYEGTNNSTTESEQEPIITFEKYIENIKSSVRQTNDGGYIVAGGLGGQAWLLKLDRYGDEEWQNTYSLGDFGYTRSVIQTSDGGYLYCSWEGIVKADSNGIEE